MSRTPIITIFLIAAAFVAVTTIAGTAGERADGARTALFTPLPGGNPLSRLDWSVPKPGRADGRTYRAAGDEACGCGADQGCCPSGGCCPQTHPYTYPAGSRCYVIPEGAQGECGDSREICTPGR